MRNLKKIRFILHNLSFFKKKIAFNTKKNTKNLIKKKVLAIKKTKIRIS